MIRIEAGEKIGSFKPECVNNVVRVTGTLVEDRIDEAYLAEWELRLKDQIARQHGEGEAGCSAEHQARGESVASSTEKRIRLPCPYRRPQSQRRQGIPFVLPCGRREL